MNTSSDHQFSAPGWILLLLLFSGGIAATEPAVRLITFGNEAEQRHGDHSNSQKIQIRIPARLKDRLYLRLYDPGASGGLDERFGPWREPLGPWDTVTRYALYPNASGSGTPVVQRDFSGADGFDRQWMTLYAIEPSGGERLGDHFIFTLEVAGISGNDGDVFDIAVSTSAEDNRQASGVALLSFFPTIALPRADGRYAELRFDIPQDSTMLRVDNYDVEHNALWLDTPLRSQHPLTGSKDNAWRSDEVKVSPEEAGKEASIMAATHPNRLNNIAVRIRDSQQRPVGVKLPIALIKRNQPPTPRAKISYLSDCHRVALDATSSRDGDGDNLVYTWLMDDGTELRGPKVNHRFETLGRHQSRLLVEDDSGRVNNQSRLLVDLILNQPPQADPGPDRLVAPGWTAFDASASTDSDGRLSRFQWDFGDGHTGQGAQVKHLFKQPGNYPVSLRVTDDSGAPCNSHQKQMQLKVNHSPQAVAGEDRTLAAGEASLFDGGQSHDPDGTITNHFWDFGDGASAEGVAVQHQYANPGVYQVTLRVTDDSGVENQSDTAQLRVSVNHPPKAQALVSASRAASGESLVFDGRQSSDTDGKIIAYRWEFGDGTGAEQALARHAFGNPGRYTVRLQVRDDSATASAADETAVELVINAPPVAIAGADQKITLGPVHFDGSQSEDSDGVITSWQWDFGDGNSANGRQVQHDYAAPGSYQVRLVVTDDSGTSSSTASDTLNVVVNALPVADAGPGRVAAPKETIGFDGTGSVDIDGQVRRYLWDFGDGTQAEGPRPEHLYQQPGDYQVRLQVWDDSGHEAATGIGFTKIRVNAQPVAVAGQNRIIAAGDTLELDGSGSHDPDGGPLTYSWRFSDEPQPLAGAKVARRFATPSVVIARLTVDDGSGVANAQAQAEAAIRINHPPHAQAGPDLVSCSQEVAFDASASSDADGDPLRYTWNFGDGTDEVQGAQVSHWYARPGRYLVLLRADDGTGTASAVQSDTLTVIINHLPESLAQLPEAVCAGEVVLFNGGNSKDPDGSVLAYHWDFGDGSSATEANPVKIYSEPGIYPVRLQVEDDFPQPCRGSADLRYLHVVAAPVADAGPDQKTCTGVPVSFDGSASRDVDGVVNGFRWDFGDGAKGGGMNPVHVYTTPGEYRVTLTITGEDNGRCKNSHSDTLNVRVDSAPGVTVVAASQAAPGQTLVFRAMGGSAKVNYHWDFGDGGAASGPEVSKAFAGPGRYRVRLRAEETGSQGCGSTLIEHPLSINAPPQPVINAPETGRAQQVLVFDGMDSNDPDGGIIRWRWSFGDGEQAEGAQVKHQFKSPGDYQVQLQVIDNAGQENSSASIMKVVRILPPQSDTAKVR